MKSWVLNCKLRHSYYENKKVVSPKGIEGTGDLRRHNIGGEYREGMKTGGTVVPPMPLCSNATAPLCARPETCSQ